MVTVRRSGVNAQSECQGGKARTVYSESDFFVQKLSPPAHSRSEVRAPTGPTIGPRGVRDGPGDARSEVARPETLAAVALRHKGTDMISNRSAWSGALVWALVTWAAWTAFVPNAISGSSLLILSAVIALVTVVFITMAGNARPTRSIAHVLHDAEEAAGRRS
jgi:hypothetical protein